MQVFKDRGTRRSSPRPPSIACTPSTVACRNTKPVLVSDPTALRRSSKKRTVHNLGRLRLVTGAAVIGVAPSSVRNATLSVCRH